MEGFTEISYEELFFTKAPVAIAYVSRNGKFTHVNEAFCELVGYTEYELAKLHFASITHPADVEADRAQADQLLSDPERGGYQMAKRYLTKDGRIVWCRLCVAALRTADGSFIRYVMHALDLPPASAYKVEHSATGVSVRPSLRWMDLLRDHPWESVVMLGIATSVIKTLDITVISKILEALKLWSTMK